MDRTNIVRTFASALLFAPFYLEAQVAPCTPQAGNVVTVAEAPEDFGNSGTVRLTYTWDLRMATGTASASVPRNATVTSVAVFAGPANTNDVVLSTACLQHGNGGWPVDFLAQPGGLAVFNGASATGPGAWIVKPVVTSYTATSVLQFIVVINWTTPAPSPTQPAPTEPSVAPPFGPSLVSLVAKHSRKCLDVLNAGMQDGAKLQQWTCNGNAQQRFWLSPAGNGSYAIIGFSGKVLDVTGESTANGVPIQQWEYLNGANQQWYLVPIGANLYKIQSRLSGKVLDVTGGPGATADGVIIQQYDYLQGANQQWLVVPNPEPAPAGIYNIVAKHSGKCLDVLNGGVQNGARLQQWDCNGNPQQTFWITPAFPGAYKIVTFSGKALDVTGFSTANGAAIQQYDLLNGSNQQWYLVPLAPGEYKIQSLWTNKVLDVTGGPAATGNGLLLQQWDYLGGANQKFILKPVQ